MAKKSKLDIEEPKAKKRLDLPDYRDVFLSHRTANKDLVRQIAADVEDDANGKQLFSWLDEAEIKKGQSIPAAVEDGLQKSRFIALIMTPEYFSEGSGWTDAEWHAVLHQDPDNKKGRILPIIAAECPYIPFLLRHLNAIDMRPRFYNEGLQDLIRTLRDEPLPRPTVYRGQLVSSGGKIQRANLFVERAVPAADPDVVNERLYCNLLPVERLPKYIFVAPLSDEVRPKRKNGTLGVPTKSELRDVIISTQEQAGVEKPYSPAFRLYEDKIFSFHDFDESPLLAVSDGDAVEVFETVELLKAEWSRNIVISLLNMAVSRHAHRVGLESDNTKIGRFFFGKEGDAPRVVRWRPKSRQSDRTVAKPWRDKNGSTVYWVHQGAYLKIVFLANRLYLQIRPTWVLTKDGHEVIQGPKVAKVINRYTGAERNHQILYHVRFWTTFLLRKKGLLSIRAGDETLDLSPIPAFVDQSYGIRDDNKDVLRLLDQEAELYAQHEEELMEQLPELAMMVGQDDSEEEEMETAE